jgi:hypothetical protein
MMPGAENARECEQNLLFFTKHSLYRHSPGFFIPISEFLLGSSNEATIQAIRRTLAGLNKRY